MAKKKSRASSPKGKKNTLSWKKVVFAFFIIILLSTLSATYFLYQRAWRPNIAQPISENQPAYIYIRNSDSFQDVVNHLSNQKLLLNISHFIWVAEYLKYPENVIPGRYLLTRNMNNYEIVKLLRSGKQTPLRITFNSFRTIEQLAGKLGKLIEADSTALMEHFKDKSFMATFSLTPEQALCIVIPDTYEFYWNTSAQGFIEKMHTSYLDFWNEERRAKAKKLGLSPAEVASLASIVQLESNKNDERPIIAGVYLNRLQKGMKLQADPTVQFASGTYGSRRVGGTIMKTDSRYNTYVYKGLPPGPIYLPSKNAIDAVLNSQSHNYLYFCARTDGSGYHDFASNYAQHQLNAAKYRRWLNKRNIRIN
jgi:UPF0755 protein